MASLLRSKKVRAIAYQVGVLLIVLGALGYASYNASINLEKSGITSGFRFLWEKAGYPINFTLIDYSPSTSSHFDAFLVGTLNTILFTILTVIFTTILSFSLAMARLSSNWLLSKIAYCIVEAVRNVPMLLHLFIWLLVFVKLPAPKKAFSIFDTCYLTNRGFYYPDISIYGLSIFSLLAIALVAFFGLYLLLKRYAMVPSSWQLKKMLAVTGLVFIGGVIVAASVGAMEVTVPVLKGFNFKGGSILPPELFTIVVAIAVYSSSHASEIVRGGVLAVPKGMTEAAYALGAKPWLTQHVIIFPLALKSIIPPMTSIYINILKASALGVAVGFMGVMSTTGGSTLNITGQAVECIVLVMGAYVIMNLTLSSGMNMLNRYVNRLGAR